MARVVAADVSAILDNTELTDAQINVYITSANVIVTDLLGSSSLTSDVLKEIERWLTAHFIAVSRERQAKKEEAGSAKIEYSGIYGEGLKSTSYGQNVLLLDSTGAFAKQGGKAAYTYAVKS